MNEHRKAYRLFKDGKSKKVYVYDLFDEFGIENCKIELIELYPCNSKMELRRREGHHQQLIDCVNRNVAGRTRKEYYADNRDAKIAYQSEYRATHRDYISERVCCPTCGCSCRRDVIARHQKSKKHIASLNSTDSDPVDSSHSSASSSTSESHVQPSVPDGSELPLSYPS
jgi:hypothetical protein